MRKDLQITMFSDVVLSCFIGACPSVFPLFPLLYLLESDRFKKISLLKKKFLLVFLSDENNITFNLSDTKYLTNMLDETGEVSVRTNW